VDVFNLANGANLYTYPTGAPIFGSAGISTGQFFGRAICVARLLDASGAYFSVSMREARGRRVSAG
jgi:hypothetical protein